MRKYRLVLAVALSIATVAAWFSQASAQTSTCSPADSVLPAGEVSPSPDNDPLIPIYCLNLQPQPPTRVSGANDWVDAFGVKGYARLQDGDMGYRVFDGQAGAARTAHMVNGDHWLDDNKVQFGGGAMLRPDRGFMFENGKLVVEGDAAAGKAVYGGDQWVEFVITTSPRPDINPPDPPEQSYAYGRFKGFPTFGCRFQASAENTCAGFTGTTLSFPPTQDKAPCYSLSPDRLWELSSFQHCADYFAGTHFGGFSDPSRKVWRRCAPSDVYDVCSDRFRIELTRTSLLIYVNGIRYFEDAGWDTDHQLPAGLLAGPVYVYFADWGTIAPSPVWRFHWERLAVNPHDANGNFLPPSASGSFTNPPVVTPTPSTTPQGPTNTPTATSTPTAPGGATSTPTSTPIGAATPTPAIVVPPTPTPVPPSGGGSSGGGGGRHSGGGSGGSSSSTQPVSFGGGGAGGGGAALAFEPVLGSPSPTAPPQTQPLAQGPRPLARDTVSTAGGMLAGDRFQLLIPPDVAGSAGADVSIWPAPGDGLPAPIGGVMLGDRPLEVRFVDVTSGAAPASFAPPLTLVYGPTDSESSQVGGNLDRLVVAEATLNGWEPLMCTRAAGNLTCSLAQPGVVVALIAPQASGLADFDLPNGHFFKQGNGLSGAGDLGYAVVDDADARMWSEFVRLGGADRLGYPISRRFEYSGFPTQVFQNGALQWQPDVGAAAHINTLDDLSTLGYDSWLDRQLQIPASSDWSGDRNLATDDVLSRHLGLLSAYPDLSNTVRSSGMLDRYGLPTGVKLYGTMLVVRFERATLQMWTSDNNLGPAGTTVTSSGAQLGKQLGLWPPEVMAPEAAPSAAAPTAD